MYEMIDGYKKGQHVATKPWMIKENWIEEECQALTEANSTSLSQYQIRQVRTCILASSDLASYIQECTLPRMGRHILQLE